MRPLRIVFAVFLPILVAACVSVPLDSLRAYEGAFQQARNAGDLLLDEISPIVSGKTGASGGGCGRSPLGYPLCFDPASAAGGGTARADEDPSIIVRRQALAVVAAYNRILVELAEGKSAEAVQSQVDELSELATAVIGIGFVPSGGLSALIAPGATYMNDLVARLESARANAAVRQAIIASADDVQALIGALKDDTPKIYEVFRAARERDLFEINHDRNLARLSKDSAAQARAQERYDAMLESIVKFHESLTAYVRLLDATSDALDALVAAIRDGPGAAARLTVLAQEAAEIEARSTEFWNTIRDVRSAAARAQN